jgi:hypothetical protein
MGVLFPQKVGDRIFQIRPDDIFIFEGLCMPLFAFIPTSSDMCVDDGPAVLEEWVVHVAVGDFVGEAVEAVDFEHELFGVLGGAFL